VDKIHDIIIHGNEVPSVPVVNVTLPKINTVSVQLQGNNFKIYEIIQPVTRDYKVPVVVEIGKPIINIPGCVESYGDETKSKTLMEDDPDGVKVYCDADTPSFTPMDFVADDLEMVQEEYKPDFKIEPPPTPPPPTPETETPCIPPKERDPITFQCIDPVEPVVGAVEEEVPIVIAEYLPEVTAVTTTATIAVVATASALLAKPLADILLRLLKPTIKQIINKAKGIVGNGQGQISVRERMIAQRDRNKAIRDMKKFLKK
tara:strand:- start:35 stop:814 length:780 start_codon:yes stop_codon:yes gene_type:complete